MFANERIKQDFEEKNLRVKNVINKKIPDRVPVILNAQTWVMQYAGISVKKALTEDKDALFDAYKVYLTDIYNDALLDISNTATYNLADKLGGGLYKVTDEWVQVTGGKGEVMKGDEYDLLIKDPKEYIANYYVPRKFPIFNQSYEKNVELIKVVFDEFVAFGQYNAYVVKRIINELGVPLFVNGCNYNPLDVLLDFLRDFRGITVDIKRQPQKVKEGCEALYNYIIEMFDDSNIDPHEDKMQFSPLHIPTYLNLKDFENSYFPFMKKYVEEISAKRGYALYLFMENNWEPYMDFVKELSDDARIVMLFEYGDMKKYKDMIGDKYVVMGGMPINYLGTRNKQQCVDKAKECIDILAPGGNYIFSIDRVPISLNEAKPENMIAVSEFAKEYGKY